MSLPADIRRRLRELGFRRAGFRREETWLRHYGSVSHAVLVERLTGIHRGGVHVSACVGHAVAERCLAQVFAELGEPVLADRAQRLPAWMLGRTLGVARPNELMWHTDLAYLDLPACSVAAAVAFMDTIRGACDIWRVKIAPWPHPWLIVRGGVLDSLQRLIIGELCRRETGASDDLSQIASAMAQNTDRTYVRMLHAHSFDHIVRTVRLVLDRNP